MQTVGKHNTKGPKEKAEQRHKIWEMYEQGKTVTEIARVLKCSISSVSSNLRRQKEKRLRIADYSKATLRDQFAMAALTGLLSSGDYSYDDVTKNAYYVADRMLEARHAKN